MKIMIAYASKSGATKECANLLHQKLDMSKVFDLSKKTPSLCDFDTIIIGSGVRMGKLYKPVLTFIKKSQKLLLSKRVAFYLCNAYPDTLEKAVEKNIPQKLAQNAVIVKSFGGKPPFTNVIDSDWILTDNIAPFVSVVLERN